MDDRILPEVVVRANSRSEGVGLFTIVQLALKFLRMRAVTIHIRVAFRRFAFGGMTGQSRYANGMAIRPAVI